MSGSVRLGVCVTDDAILGRLFFTDNPAWVMAMKIKDERDQAREIAAELAAALEERRCSCSGTGLQHKPGYTHYETDAGEECPAYHYGPCPRCESARAALAKAKAAGISPLAKIER